jgi:hypothetical protein
MGEEIMSLDRGRLYIPLTITKEEKIARNLPFYLSVKAHRG